MAAAVIIRNTVYGYPAIQKQSFLQLRKAIFDGHTRWAGKGKD
jgi:hypothetical protein